MFVVILATLFTKALKRESKGRKKKKINTGMGSLNTAKNAITTLCTL